MRRLLPLVLALAIGWLTVIGLLFLPELAALMTGWASFLAAVALLLGVANLLRVHGPRLAQGNGYSAVLVVALLAVLGLGIADAASVTQSGVEAAFDLLQAPLEGALAGLVGLFLLLAGVKMAQRQRTWWTALFVVVAVIALLARSPLPPGVAPVVGVLAGGLNQFVVSAGMRGIVIGVALGAVAIGLRMLLGSERPYDQ